MKRLVCLLAVLALALPLFARGPAFKSWGSSPQALFMTKAERDQWATIDNEAAAQKFIADFVAKRQPDFAKIVADRAAKADQYLSFGKTLGSTTLLGKIIILFGPPAGMEVATTQHQGHAQMTSEAMQGAGGEATGLNVADAAQAVQAGGMSSTSTNTYTVTYRAKSVPTLDKDLIVVVEAPLAGGRQQIRDSKSAAEVNDLFERVEAASIVPAASH